MNIMSCNLENLGKQCYVVQYISWSNVFLVRFAVAG